jgi:MFS family permease
VRLPRLTVDLSPLRASRDLRLLLGGEFVTGLGTQAALVAVPYQMYTETHSPFLTGLLGAVELGPLIAGSLLSGALADRVDRRRLLLTVQIALVATASTLAAVSFAGHPPVPLLYVLAALLAAFGSVESVTRAAIVPKLVPPAQLRPALALNYGLSTLTMVIGPAVGGVVIGAAGVGWAYAADAGTCLAMAAAAAAMAAQPPAGAPSELGIARDIVEGLRYVRSNQALMGSFFIDLAAMTFGMPRALFPVLSLTVYHSGAAGTGVLFAAVAAGATVAALTTGWLRDARRLGLIVLWAVIVWGTAIALAGFASSLWIAAVLLAVAGGADSVSAVCRSTINQSVTPDAMRGRMSAVYMLVVTSGPRLGDLESGGVASLASPRVSVVSGGLACLAGAALVVAAFPALLAYDAERALAVQPA